MGGTETDPEGPPRWLLIFLISLTVVMALSSLSSLIFLYCFRKKPIVAMGQPPMLAILCLGALVFSISFALYAVVLFKDPGSKSDAEMNVYCSWFMWLAYLGVITMLTILICKLYRVHKIMKFRRNQVVRPYHVFGPFIFVLLLGIGTLTAREILDPQQYGPFPGDDGTFEAPYCVNERGDVIFEIVKNGIILALYIGILKFACGLRHVSEEIGDSRKIFFMLCFDTFVYAINTITMCLMHSSNLGEKERYIIILVVFSLVHFFAVMATMNILILPRMYYVWYEKVHGSLPENVRTYGTGQVRVNVGGPKTTATTASITNTLPPTTTITDTLPSGGNSDGEKNEGV